MEGEKRERERESSKEVEEETRKRREGEGREKRERELTDILPTIPPKDKYIVRKLEENQSLFLHIPASYLHYV